MPSPQSGSACTVDTPEAPMDAVDADVADPGLAAEARESITTEGQSATGGGNESSEKESEDESEETHWIGVELKDDEGNPIPGEAFKVKLPDGTIISGRLDKDGKARVEGLPECGDCEVSFPRIHGDEWSSL